MYFVNFIVYKLIQFQKADLPISLTVLLKLIDVKPLQPQNIPSGIVVMLNGNLTYLMLVQLAKTQL